MSTPFQPVLSLSELKLEAWERGTRYQAEDASFGAMLGLTRIGASYTVVPPGKSSCPYHNHHLEDEMFVILEGEGEYRFGGVIHPLKAGDVLGAPVGGPEHAHQLVNTGSGPLRYIGISNHSDTEVCEYPDSGKFLVSSRRAADGSKLRVVGRAAISLDYWDGEEGS